MCCENQVNMREQLEQVIRENKDIPGALIPVLHKTQEIYGYLPFEAQKIIAEGLEIPISKVYGVATFYSQFYIQKKGKYRVNVCMGTACYVKGSAEILNKFKERLGIEVGECTDDGMFSLDACRCIGACGLAPVATVNDEVFGRLAADDVDGIIDKFIKEEAEA